MSVSVGYHVQQFLSNVQVLYTYLSGPPVKIGIEFMNHRTILLDSLQTNNIRINQEENQCICNSPKPDHVQEGVRSPR